LAFGPACGYALAATLDAYDADDLGAVNAHLMRTAQRLADAGCDFFVCPDNTAHIALDAATAPSWRGGAPA
jgi:aspartate racemase